MNLNLNAINGKSTTDPNSKLIPSEQRVFQLLIRGYMYKSISDELNLSIHMVKQYAHRIYKKLEIANRTEALIRFHSGSLSM